MKDILYWIILFEWKFRR